MAAARPHLSHRSAHIRCAAGLARLRQADRHTLPRERRRHRGLFPRRPRHLRRHVLDGCRQRRDSGAYSLEELFAFPKRYPLAARWMRRPFVEFLATYVADPAAQRLIRSLTGYITDRPETLTVADMIPIYGYYFHGGFYPEGGSGRLAEVL